MHAKIFPQNSLSSPGYPTAPYLKGSLSTAMLKDMHWVAYP